MTAPNVIYGEGIREGGQPWRNQLLPTPRITAKDLSERIGDPTDEAES